MRKVFPSDGGFHQSDNMLRELTDKNLTYLHIWGENLQNTSSEDEIRNYIKNAQEDAGFLDFFFLSADGNYKMVTGENRVPWITGKYWRGHPAGK